MDTTAMHRTDADPTLHLSPGVEVVVGAALVPPGRSWTIATSGGSTVTGYLPGWAEEDPSKAGVAFDRLEAELEDVGHHAPFAGQVVRLALGGYGPGEEAEVFSGSIDCHPFTEGEDSPTPLVNVHVIEDFWIVGLGPDDLATLAAKLRAQADRLDHDIRPRLTAYREDWAAHRSL